MTLVLPPPLVADDPKAAIALVRSYLAPAARLAGGVAYTGSRFDLWAGGGDRSEAANRFTNDDINAVGFLSVEIPPRAVMEIVEDQTVALSELLERIPNGLPLHEADSDVLAEGSASWQLWDRLKSIEGVGWVSAGKLCARKRPHLLPIYDQRVKALVGAPKNFWEELRQALQDDGQLLARLREVHTATGAEHLSLLRIFDIVAWMYASAR